MTCGGSAGIGASTACTRCFNAAICELVDEWSMVQFMPLDPRDPDSIDLILAQIDNAIQYHDDVEPKVAPDDADADGELGDGADD